MNEISSSEFINFFYLSDWAKKPLEMKKNETWEEVYYRESEEVYEALQGVISKAILEGKRDILLKTIYKIVKNKASFYLGLDKLNIQYQEKKIELKDEDELFKTLFNLVEQPSKSSLVKFCRKLDLYSKLEDKYYFNASVEIVGGEKMWTCLQTFLNAKNLKECCSTALPRKIVQINMKNCKSLALMPSNRFSVEKTFRWSDKEKAIAKISRSDVKRSIFGETSDVTITFIPRSVTFKNEIILKGETSKETEFKNNCLIKLFTVFDDLLVKAGHLSNHSSKQFILDAVEDYLIQNESTFNSIVLSHDSVEYLKGFAINTTFFAIEILKEHFPEFGGSSIDGGKFFSECDKEFGTEFEIGINNKKNIYIEQKKQFLVKIKVGQDDSLATYQLVWKLSMEKGEWKGKLNIINVSFSREIEEEVKRSLFTAFTKFDILN